MSWFGFERLPTKDIDASVGGLVKRLLVTAIVLAALAVLAGVILGQQVTGPAAMLTDAAERLGHGDFSTSIPIGGTQEVGKLARTMEDMRNNLVELTGALRRREAEAQAVLSGIVEGVYAVDKSRVIRYLNPQAARLLGVQPSEVIGRFCGDVLKPCLDSGGQRPCGDALSDFACALGRQCHETQRLDLNGGTPRTTIITSAAPVDELQVQKSFATKRSSKAYVEHAIPCWRIFLMSSARRLLPSLRRSSCCEKGWTPCRPSNKRNSCCSSNAARCSAHRVDRQPARKCSDRIGSTLAFVTRAYRSRSSLKMQML